MFFNHHFSSKAKKTKAIKRRRKVVKQRRRGGYGGRRRTARKVSNDESLPFTPKQKQQYIKGNIKVNVNFKISTPPLNFKLEY